MLAFNPVAPTAIRIQPPATAVEQNTPTDAIQNTAGEADSASAGRDQAQSLAANSQLSEAEQQQVQKLAARDREVRTHEQAHLSASGGLAMGGASFSFQTGPDGQRYAVGGEVSIDTSEVPGDPRATLQKADTIRRAALAPAQPSSQDFRVAAKASQMAARARQELSLMQNEQQGQSAPGAAVDIRI
ncbi:MAG: putative metalloprotease CJM1_0395 family protein [Methylococcales bacterium]|nr:putative metalloprotease CJM1_0395 family protein [Methylococcales bacterium]